MISYHSLEDRIVKRRFVREHRLHLSARPAVCACGTVAELRRLTRKAQRPTTTRSRTIHEPAAPCCGPWRRSHRDRQPAPDESFDLEQLCRVTRRRCSSGRGCLRRSWCSAFFGLIFSPGLARSIRLRAGRPGQQICDRRGQALGPAGRGRPAAGSQSDHRNRASAGAWCTPRAY